MNPNAEKLSRAAVMAMARPEMKRIVSEVANGEDVADKIASVALSILNGLDEKAGGTVPPDAMPEAAQTIVTELVELVQAVGGQVDESTVGEALRELLEQAAEQGQQGAGPAAGRSIAQEGVAYG